MTKTHIFRSRSADDSLMFCGVRSSQNPELTTAYPPEQISVRDLKNRYPDLCEECLKQYKINILEKPKTSKVRVAADIERPRKFRNHEERKSFHRDRKFQQEDKW